MTGPRAGAELHMGHLLAFSSDNITFRGFCDTTTGRGWTQDTCKEIHGLRTYYGLGPLLGTFIAVITLTFITVP